MGKDTSKKALSQCNLVLAHMIARGSITQMEAVNDYGCYRLSARIADLRERGYAIKTVTEKGKNRYGHNTQYARYYLEEETA